MTRRSFLAASSASAAGGATSRTPGTEPHFPSALHQLVWRNWELANVDRMASVAGCNERDILSIGHSMGLPPKPALTADQLRRIYITTIRQNWHSASQGRMRELIEAESNLARRLYTLARQHSVVAYEASNHYFYRPLDLAEKVIQCQWLLS